MAQTISIRLDQSPEDKRLLKAVNRCKKRLAKKQGKCSTVNMIRAAILHMDHAYEIGALR